MSATLYHGAPNGPSLTVLAAVHEVGADVALAAIDLAAGDRHRLPLGREAEMSVEGEGPVLLAGGEAMADSVFLAQYLDEAYGGALQPADAYARWEMEMWCRFIIERVAPGAALLGSRAHLTPRLQAMDEAEFEALIARIASADLAARWRKARAGEYADAQVEDSRTKIRQAVEKLEKRIGDSDWILGAFTIADLESYAWLAGMVALVPEAFADAPRTNAWLARVKARPSVQKALASAEGDPLSAWAPGPEINRWG